MKKWIFSSLPFFGNLSSFCFYMFCYVEFRPEWMSEEEKAAYITDINRINYHWDIDKELTGCVADL